MNKKNFISLIEAEVIKLRKSPALFLTLGAPLFLATVVFFIFFFKAERIITSPEISMQEYFGNSFSFLTLLIPLFLILINVFAFNLEYKFSSFKTLFALPIQKRQVILSKFLVLVMMFVVSAVTLQILLYLGFQINAIKYGELFVFETDYFMQSCLVLLQMVGTSLLMLALQFYFSFKWKNIVVAMSLGIMGFISFLILINGWEYIIYHPYAFPALSLEGFRDGSVILSNQLWYSLVGVVFVLGIILWETKTKKIID